jgi:hypothetical protein
MTTTRPGDQTPRTPAETAHRLVVRWDRLRLAEGRRVAVCRRSQILIPLDKLAMAPVKSLSTAHAWTTMIELEVFRFAADYLAAPTLVEAASTPGDPRTVEGFITAARIYRDLDETAARALLDLSDGSLAHACLYLSKVGTDKFSHRWDPTVGPKGTWVRARRDAPSLTQAIAEATE